MSTYDWFCGLPSKKVVGVYPNSSTTVSFNPTRPYRHRPKGPSFGYDDLKDPALKEYFARPGVRKWVEGSFAAMGVCSRCHQKDDNKSNRTDRLFGSRARFGDYDDESHFGANRSGRARTSPEGGYLCQSCRTHIAEQNSAFRNSRVSRRRESISHRASSPPRPPTKHGPSSTTRAPVQFGAFFPPLLNKRTGEVTAKKTGRKVVLPRVDQTGARSAGLQHKRPGGLYYEAGEPESESDSPRRLRPEGAGKGSRQPILSDSTRDAAPDTFAALTDQDSANEQSLPRNERVASVQNLENHRHNLSGQEASGSKTGSMVPLPAPAASVETTPND
ncbi:hypothetical protein HDU85_003091 [Gaertneriomyces sp. JEL0708]|nr:hypothetical protein HDU85_003091 [Gaertneriomyces sp. JEL0708]